MNGIPNIQRTSTEFIKRQNSNDSIALIRATDSPFSRNETPSLEQEIQQYAHTLDTIDNSFYERTDFFERSFKILLETRITTLTEIKNYCQDIQTELEENDNHLELVEPLANIFDKIRQHEEKILPILEIFIDRINTIYKKSSQIENQLFDIVKLMEKFAIDSMSDETLDAIDSIHEITESIKLTKKKFEQKPKKEKVTTQDRSIPETKKQPQFLFPQKPLDQVFSKCLENLSKIANFDYEKMHSQILDFQYQFLLQVNDLSSIKNSCEDIKYRVEKDGERFEGYAQLSKIEDTVKHHEKEMIKILRNVLDELKTTVQAPSRASSLWFVVVCIKEFLVEYGIHPDLHDRLVVIAPTPFA